LIALKAGCEQPLTFSKRRRQGKQFLFSRSNCYNGPQILLSLVIGEIAQGN
tara:strand:- start:15410 stop:15562 length:153 start_codon:yes stop_codon:yes gene_type:complete